MIKVTKKIGTRLLFFFLIIALVPLAVLTYTTYTSSVAAIATGVRNNLSAVAESKANRIELYVSERLKNVDAMAKTPEVLKALETMSSAFGAGGKNTDGFRTADASVRPIMTYFADSMSYNDLFLINSKGDAVFSIRKGEDLGTNYLTGPFKDSELTAAMQAAKEKKKVTVSNFEYYQATNEPAAFVAAPILQNSAIVGYVVAQLKNDEFYAVVNDYSGLGETGETVLGTLKGKNATVIAPIRSDQSAAFKRRYAIGEARLESLQEAVQGKGGYGTGNDHRDTLTVASWKYLPSLRWGMVVKMDSSEAFELIAKQRSAVVWLSVATILAVLGAALTVARSISRPIIDLTQKVLAAANGDLSQTVAVKSADEIGVLGSSFNKMTGNLRELMQEIEKKNRELSLINGNLEKIVEERTATIKRILNNVKSGFFILNRDGLIADGFTKSCETLFSGRMKTGERFETVFGMSSRDAAFFLTLLDQVYEDILPEAMSLEQLPRRFKVEGISLHVQGAVIRDAAGKIESILFTVIDGTELERMEIEARNNSTIIQILKHRDAFKEFITDCKALFERAHGLLASGNQRDLRPILHTLKGNVGSFGLTAIANDIHHVEDHAVIRADHISSIESSVKKFMEDNVSILGLVYDGTIEQIFEVRKQSLAELRNRLAAAGSIDSALDQVHQWIDDIQQKRAAELVGSVPEYVTKLADRLSKKVRVVIDGGDVRLNPDHFKGFFQVLPHLLRNSIDHGIELPWERGDKNEEGTLTLAFAEDASHWSIHVADDGKGINLDRIAAKAVEKGLTTQKKVDAMSAAEKAKLIFFEGVSSAEVVTDISGRGVGMSAVAMAVEEIEGSIAIQTAVGKGTTFAFKFPKSKLKNNDLSRAA